MHPSGGAFPRGKRVAQQLGEVVPGPGEPFGMRRESLGAQQRTATLHEDRFELDNVAFDPSRNPNELAYPPRAVVIGGDVYDQVDRACNGRHHEPAADVLARKQRQGAQLALVTSTAARPDEEAVPAGP